MPDIDEDIMRQLMTRATEDLFAPRAAAAQALRRQRRHQARARVTAVAGTAAAAGLAAGVLVPAVSGGARPAAQARPGSGSVTAAPARLTAAQRTLFGLSAAAAKAKRPSGRYVVQTDQTTSTDSGGTDGATTEKGRKTLIIDTLTGAAVAYQYIAVINGHGTPQPPSVLRVGADPNETRAHFDALPTDPAALRAVLLTTARQQLQKVQKVMEQKWRQESKSLHKPYKALPSQPPVPDDDLVASEVADLLYQPHLSPALRSALYKVLAAIPGVQVQTGVTDDAGRPATVLTGRSATGYTSKTYLDPGTGATLEEKDTGPGGSLDEDLIMHTTYTTTIPPNPYKS